MNWTLSKDKILYILSAIFSAGGILLIMNAGDVQALLLGILTLLFFGGGAIAVYVFGQKGNKKIERQGDGVITIGQNRGKLIALFTICLIFVVCCVLFLPYFYLFNGFHKYNPAIGFFLGITGTLFFGLGVLGSIKRLIKPEMVMQISGEGLLIPQGKRQELIHWDEILSTSHDDKYLFIHLSAPDPAVERTVYVSFAMAECSVDEIEKLIWDKSRQSSY